MKTATAILGALALSNQVSAVVDKWTPEGYDWTAHKGRYGVATQNMTAHPPTQELVLHVNAKQSTNGTDLHLHENFPIAITLGAVVRVGGWIASIGGAVSTAIGCWEYLTAEAKEEETTDASRASCVLGLASTVLGFGFAGLGKYIENQAAALAAARASALPPSLPPVDLGPGFRETLELANFATKAKRHAASYLRERGLSAEEEFLQYYHDDFTANMIRDAKLGEGEFLGYANNSHPLTKRDGVHALVPRFAFKHPKHGDMVLSTRFADALHITVEPHIIGNPKVHKRWQEKYQAEVADNGRILEGRFDADAATADPGNPTVDAAEMFGAAEDTLHCVFDGNPWDTNSLIDMQFYDDDNRATAGYASVGLFNDHSHDGDLGNTMPQPPVTGGENC